ncbi:MAG: hypothetical protein ACRDRV_18480 [Pseudonocardiaceae bacterium]
MLPRSITIALKSAFAAAAVALLGVVSGQPAGADPAPGYDFDPAKLEAKMDACMEYRVGEQEILIGWMNVRNGDVRQWRCSSLRHMLLDTDDRPPHDPYVNIPDFIRCADKVVSYGFPRPGDPGNTRLIYQYNGTSNQAYVIVNDVTGDIASIYTSVSNDWTGCANGL